jgi:hypothetical protein
VANRGAPVQTEKSRCPPVVHLTPATARPGTHRGTRRAPRRCAPPAGSDSGRTPQQGHPLVLRLEARHPPYASSLTKIPRALEKRHRWRNRADAASYGRARDVSRGERGGQSRTTGPTREYGRNTESWTRGPILALGRRIASGPRRIRNLRLPDYECRENSSRTAGCVPLGRPDRNDPVRADELRIRREYGSSPEPEIRRPSGKAVRVVVAAPRARRAGDLHDPCRRVAWRSPRLRRDDAQEDRAHPRSFEVRLHLRPHRTDRAPQPFSARTSRPSAGVRAGRRRRLQRNRDR